MQITERVRKVPKSILGVGTNDADYKVKTVIDGKTYLCPYYVTWHSMLQRCYSKSYQALQPTYLGCTVCPEWFIFSKFKSWMLEQDWEGRELDKDLLVHSNKVYSPETCIFLPKALNRLVASTVTLNEAGLYFDSLKNSYQVRCYADGKSTFLGYHADKLEAMQVYKNFKATIIESKAALQDNEIIKEALLNLALTLKS